MVKDFTTIMLKLIGAMFLFVCMFIVIGNGDVPSKKKYNPSKDPAMCVSSYKGMFLPCNSDLIPLEYRLKHLGRNT